LRVFRGTGVLRWRRVDDLGERPGGVEDVSPIDAERVAEQLSAGKRHDRYWATRNESHFVRRQHSARQISWNPKE
jgi:hypothetical protein